MLTVVAYADAMNHAQQCARALLEVGALDRFVTSFVFRPQGRLASVVARLPSAQARTLTAQLRRRSFDEIPAQMVDAYPSWELLRIMAVRCGAGPVIADRIWHRMSLRFDATVARRYVPRTQAVMAFEYAACATFARARREGVARILQLPARDNREAEAILRDERAKWPALATPQDKYFKALFERRYERRQREIADADLVITNSALTARSHIKAGASPDKVIAVPLAAPRAIDAGGLRYDHDRPLEVLFAGNFSLIKGAHVLLEAWRLLDARRSARLQVFGRANRHDPFFTLATDDIVFHGSVPSDRLFEAYQAADVLVLPTLSDGFGMVVLEAMAHGLPVITTDQAGAAELVCPSNGIVVPAADARALADALRWCLDNRIRLAAMRYGALETARGRQWSDFRKDLRTALDVGLTRAGYSPAFVRPTC